MIELARFVGACLWVGFALAALLEASSRWGLVGFGLSLAVAAVLIPVGLSAIGVEPPEEPIR